MHHKIEFQGTKKDVIAKMAADKGPADAGVKVLFDNAVKIALGLLANSKDDRIVEVTGYVALGDPAGSLSFSLKVEG